MSKYQESSEWILDDAISWPSVELHRGVATRRQELYAIMERVEAAMARPSGLADWRIEIESALNGLEKSLADHISETEAADGLFAEIIDREPHLKASVDSLRQEHRDLEAACREAVSMAADWSPQRLRRKGNALLARLAIHRQTGAELLFDAFNVDIAAGD